VGEFVEAEGEAESSAEATKGTVLTAPPMPRAIARAPTRPMYLDDSANNMVNLSPRFLATGVTKISLETGQGNKFRTVG
jgi:hypothetical protein